MGNLCLLKDKLTFVLRHVLCVCELYRPYKPYTINLRKLKFSVHWQIEWLIW